MMKDNPNDQDTTPDECHPGWQVYPSMDRPINDDLEACQIRYPCEPEAKVQTVSRLSHRSSRQANQAATVRQCTKCDRPRPPPILDASPDTGAQEGVNEAPPEDSERVPNSESHGASTPDAPTQASVGDGVKIEPPAAYEISQSSSPVQDVVTLEDADDESTRLTCKEEGPLPVGQEEPATYVPTSTEQPSLDVSTSSPVTQRNVQTVSPESMAGQVSQMIIDFTGETLPTTPARSDGPTVAQVKTYVADQVRRWERVTTEFVASPTIEYSWPSPPPDFQTWWAAAMSTSEYIASRTAMTSSDEAWISEWNLVSQLGPRVVPSACFPSGSESGAYGRRRSTAAASGGIPRVARCHFGCCHPNCAGPSLQTLNDEVMSEEGDVTMLEYEAGLLGREWLLRMRVAGVRKVRSPASSAVDKPESKRSQFGPARPSSIPSLSSHLSYPSSVQTVQNVDNRSGPMSVAQSVSSRRTPDRESSLFGTTVAGSDESNFSSVSGSRSSGRLSSSSSSMWSFGGAEASSHMPHDGLTGVVMMAQGGLARGGCRCPNFGHYAFGPTGSGRSR
ncbi:unnamed protein product [Phytophthora fragariaefolia]|uniref:Unnamed protein product n=1 Tax=Phytophthora fragariaefolia TaxID=1490495 RepID=A0A9W6TSZ6_9STRA|nr:unnamed protein product [Phytophthora fragariaefolia]